MFRPKCWSYTEGATAGSHPALRPVPACRKLEADNVELQRRLQNLHPEKENKEALAHSEFPGCEFPLIRVRLLPSSSSAKQQLLFQEGSAESLHEQATRLLEKLSLLLPKR